MSCRFFHPLPGGSAQDPLFQIDNLHPPRRIQAKYPFFQGGIDFPFQKVCFHSPAGTDIPEFDVRGEVNSVPFSETGEENLPPGILHVVQLDSPGSGKMEGIYPIESPRPFREIFANYIGVIPWAILGAQPLFIRPGYFSGYQGNDLPYSRTEGEESREAPRGGRPPIQAIFTGDKGFEGVTVSRQIEERLADGTEGFYPQ